MKRRFFAVAIAAMVAIALLTVTVAASASSLSDTATLSGLPGATVPVVTTVPDDTVTPTPEDKLPPGDCSECGECLTSQPSEPLPPIIEVAAQPAAIGRVAAALADLPESDGECYHISLTTDTIDQAGKKQYKAQVLKANKKLNTQSIVETITDVDVDPKDINKGPYKFTAKVSGITTKNAASCDGGAATDIFKNGTATKAKTAVSLKDDGLVVTIEPVEEGLVFGGVTGYFSCKPKK